jgi:hypothetical protein
MMKILDFSVAGIFRRGHGPVPTDVDAETKVNLLFANGFCRVGVLHPAYKTNFHFYHPMDDKTMRYLFILLI